MKNKILIGTFLFSLGMLAGQKLMVLAYNPVTLEDLVIQHTKSTYALGCSEGIKAVTGRGETFLLCLDLAESAVKDNEDILRGKVWHR